MHRWGPEGKDDFWTALAHGEVETPELRAMTLLESVCDEYRFTLYSFTGEMPAMGNVTGTMFSIQKKGGVIELDEHGTPCGHWCISIGPHSPVPGTDNIVVLKAMLEGEENEFRRIGNRSSFHGARIADPVGIVAPHHEHLIPRDWRKAADELRDRTGNLPDLFELSGMIDVLEQEHREKEEQGMLRMARQVGQMNRVAEECINPDRMLAQWYGMRLGDGLMEQQFTDGRRVRYDPRAFADLDLDPLEALNLYDGPQAAQDLDDLRRIHEREERAFVGVPLAGAPRGELENLREAIALQVRRELDRGADGFDGGQGIRLRDGTMLNWDRAEAQDVFMRTGIVVADEIHRMNNEGYNAEMIRYAMLEFFGVHQITDGGFGQYITGPGIGVQYAARGQDYIEEPDYLNRPMRYWRHQVPRGAVARPVGNGQFMLL